MVKNLLSLGFISLYLIMVLSCVIFKSVFCLRAAFWVLMHAMFCYMFDRGGEGGGGEGDSIAFHLRFLTHSVCQCDVT